MGLGQWMSVLDAVSGIAQVVGRRRSAAADAPSGPAPGGAIEARLAGVVVAALTEAFDRDRARMDLEREQVELERRRAEQALKAELRRQASERASGQLRLIAIMAIGAWMLSAALAGWLAGMRAGVPRTLLGSGWASALATIGCAFAGWQQISAWTTTMDSFVSEMPRSAPAVAAPWLLLLALALIGASVLIAL